MILVVDVGNTNIVTGIIDDGKIINTARMATNSLYTAQEYAVKLKDFFEFDKIDYSQFKGAVISSVVPPLTSTLSQAIKRLTGLDSIIVGAGIKTGLNIKIDNPAQLGSDLVVAAVAALASYPTPSIIIDMGTATTLTVLAQDGALLGGAIIPGLGLSMSALASGTSQLPKVSIEPPKKCISSNTVDCMKSGAVFGSASMLDGMIERIEEELGAGCCVVATGGISKLIAPYCKHKIICDDELLLRGLAIIYEKNAK